MEATSKQKRKTISKQKRLKIYEKYDGHWHHYWAGSGADRHLILKWNPPTFIHSEWAADHDITINQVQDKGQRR